MCPSLRYHSPKPVSLGRIAGEMVGVEGRGGEEEEEEEEEEASSYPVVPLVFYPARECGGRSELHVDGFMLLLLLLHSTAGETILFWSCFCDSRAS